MDNTVQTLAQQQDTVQPAPLGQATSALFSFFFKTDKIRDNDGKVIGNGRKHPDVKTVLPVPTFVELLAALEAGGKTAELILELVTGAIDTAARGQINDWRETNGLEKDFTPTAFDISKLSLEAIANTPRSERGGPAFSEDEVTGFLDDYSSVMVNAVGYDAKKVALHVSHFKTQFRRIKNDKQAVGKLYELLQMWLTKTEAADEYAAIYQDLEKRANRYMKAEDKNLAEAF